MPLPEKLKSAVEESRTDAAAVSNPKRREIVTGLCGELVRQLREDVMAEEWSTLRATGELDGAVERFVRRLDQCATRSGDLHTNASFGRAASTAATLSTVLAEWPRGLEAFAEHQEASIASLCRGDKSLDSVDGVLRPASGRSLDTKAMCGLICVLYLRPTLTQLDLDRIKISPASLATLAGALPDAVTALSLDQSDCANKGTDLLGIRALMEHIHHGASSLTSLNLARIGLTDTAAPLIVQVGSE